MLPTSPPSVLATYPTRSPVDHSRLHRLNERQRQCLRLVYANYEAKEIASKLGLSPHTVHEHLRDARRTLGVSRSMQAARLLFAFEKDNCVVPDLFGVERRPIVDEDAFATEPAQPANVVRNRYNLTVLQRIGLIVAIAFVAVALAGALLVGADAITRIFWNYQIDISDPPYSQ